MLLYKADGKFTSQHNKLIKLLLQYNKIQYNSLLTLPWWGFSVTMRLKKKLIKIREVVNNSIRKERMR